MKKPLALLALALAFVLSAPAQSATTHSVTLAWQDKLNPTTGTTYNVYRATGLCSGSPSYSKIASSLTTLTYQDTTVIPGNYCYYVTAVVGGAESAPSNTTGPLVPSFPPSSVTSTVQ